MVCFDKWYGKNWKNVTKMFELLFFSNSESSLSVLVIKSNFANVFDTRPQFEWMKIQTNQEAIQQRKMVYFLLSFALYAIVNYVC